MGKKKGEERCSTEPDGKEYVIWGITPEGDTEEPLHTTAKNRCQAMKVKEILEKKHGCKKCRIQIIDFSEGYDMGEDWKGVVRRK